jgi:hypothetical protein
MSLEQPLGKRVHRTPVVQRYRCDHHLREVCERCTSLFHSTRRNNDLCARSDKNSRRSGLEPVLVLNSCAPLRMYAVLLSVRAATRLSLAGCSGMPGSANARRFDRDIDVGDGCRIDGGLNGSEVRRRRWFGSWPKRGGWRGAAGSSAFQAVAGGEPRLERHGVVERRFGGTIA